MRYFDVAMSDLVLLQVVQDLADLTDQLLLYVH